MASLVWDFQGEAARTLSFVAEAISDDETRYMMCGMRIEREEDGRKVAVATDGRRLHFVYLDELESYQNIKEIPDGLYKVMAKSSAKKFPTLSLIQIKEADAGQFPNWKRVIPEGSPTKTIEWEMSEKKDRQHVCICRLIHALPEDKGLNFSYLAPLAGSKWTVEFNGDRAIVFKTPKSETKTKAIERTALIMPTNLNP